MNYNQLVELGNQVKYSFQAKYAMKGDISNREYRKLVFSSLQSWITNVNNAECNSEITTDQMFYLFNAMIAANANTINDYRKNNIQPEVQLSEVELLKLALAKSEITNTKLVKELNEADRTITRLSKDLDSVKSAIRTLMCNSVINNTVAEVKVSV